jgi:hypothetical protein
MASLKHLGLYIERISPDGSVEMLGSRPKHVFGRRVMLSSSLMHTAAVTAANCQICHMISGRTNIFWRMSRTEAPE